MKQTAPHVNSSTTKPEITVRLVSISTALDNLAVAATANHNIVAALIKINAQLVEKCSPRHQVKTPWQPSRNWQRSPAATVVGLMAEMAEE